MLELNSDQVHLWFTFVDEIHDKDLLGRYRLLLQKEEVQREQRIQCAANRHRYLVTRALVRTVLSRYAPVAPEKWSFSQNAYGKPYISNSDALARRISFNVSHTKGLIVLGVTYGGAIGVDTENMLDRRRPLNSSCTFFSSEETSALELLPSHTQQERLFQYWTLKEAYVKARGMGLSIPINQVNFHFLEQDRIRLSIHMPLEDNSTRWYFWQLRPSEIHLTAVCAERCDSGSKELVTKQIVPLGTEQSLSCISILESE